MTNIIIPEVGDVYHDNDHRSAVLGDTYLFITNVNTKTDRLHYRYVYTNALYRDPFRVYSNRYSLSQFIKFYEKITDYNDIMIAFGYLAKNYPVNQLEWLLSRAACPLTRDDVGLILLNSEGE